MLLEQVTRQVAKQSMADGGTILFSGLFLCLPFSLVFIFQLLLLYLLDYF